MYNSLKTLKTEINSEKIDKLIPLFFFPELLPSFKDTINNIGIVVITDYTSSIAYVHHKGEVASVIIIDSILDNLFEEPDRGFPNFNLQAFIENKSLKMQPLTEPGLPKPPRYSDQYKKLRRKKW